jgi:hypothetical protein
LEKQNLLAITGNQARVTVGGSAMNVALGALCALVLVATQANAADVYQLHPLFSASGTQGGTLLNSHFVLIVNTTTGETMHCMVRYRPEPRGGQEIFPFKACTKSGMKTGSMPPGLAVLSALSNTHPPNDTMLPAIWKIDQSTGRVTFCGAAGWTFDGAALEWQCNILN